jgi:hypothetical protein
VPACSLDGVRPEDPEAGFVWWGLGLYRARRHVVMGRRHLHLDAGRSQDGACWSLWTCFVYRPSQRTRRHVWWIQESFLLARYFSVDRYGLEASESVDISVSQKRGNNWTEQNPTKQPPPLYFTRGASDPVLKEVVVFGGGSVGADRTKPGHGMAPTGRSFRRQSILRFAGVGNGVGSSEPPVSDLRGKCLQHDQVLRRHLDVDREITTPEMGPSLRGGLLAHKPHCLGFSATSNSRA